MTKLKRDTIAYIIGFIGFMFVLYGCGMVEYGGFYPGVWIAIFGIGLMAIAYSKSKSRHVYCNRQKRRK